MAHKIYTSASLGPWRPVTIVLYTVVVFEIEEVWVLTTTSPFEPGLKQRKMCNKRGRMREISFLSFLLSYSFLFTRVLVCRRCHTVGAPSSSRHLFPSPEFS